MRTCAIEPNGKRFSLYKGHNLHSLVFSNLILGKISIMRCLKVCLGKNNILSDLVVFGFLQEQRKCFIFLNFRESSVSLRPNLN